MAREALQRGRWAETAVHRAAQKPVGFGLNVAEASVLAVRDADTAVTMLIAMPNVRAKRETTAGRQARPQENVHRTLWPGLVACRWRSA